MRAFQDMLLGPLKAVLMRVLQQQLSKYIHNIELEELGLMGGDVVLENLGVTCRCWRTAPEKMTACVYEGCTCMHSQPSTAEDDAENAPVLDDYTTAVIYIVFTVSLWPTTSRLV